jgi:hypothetical protein
MDKITQLQCQLHNLAFYMTEPLYAIKFHSPPAAIFKDSEVIQDEEVLHRINEFQQRTLNVLAKNIVDTSNNVKIVLVSKLSYFIPRSHSKSLKQHIFYLVN